MARNKWVNNNESWLTVDKSLIVRFIIDQIHHRSRASNDEMYEKNTEIDHRTYRSDSSIDGHREVIVQ